jgi:hypothetical protein
MAEGFSMKSKSHDGPHDMPAVEPAPTDASMTAGRAKATFAGGAMVPEAQAGEGSEPPMAPDAQIADSGAPDSEPPLTPTDTSDESGGVVSAGAGGPLHGAVVEIAGAADGEKTPGK